MINKRKDFSLSMLEPVGLTFHKGTNFGVVGDLKGVFENFLSYNKILCMKLNQKFSLPRYKAQNSKAPEKQSVVSSKQSVVYTSKAITTEFK